MKPTAATGHLRLEILGRPEGGLGETGPAVVSPSGPTKARREVVATLHQLIDTLMALEDEPRRDDTSEVRRGLPLLLNADEAGKLLSISRAKVLDMAARGQLPSIRVGGSVRIPRDRLISWIDDHFADIAGTTRITLRPSRALRGHPA